MPGHASGFEASFPRQGASTEKALSVVASPSFMSVGSWQSFNWQSERWVLTGNLKGEIWVKVIHQVNKTNEIEVKGEWNKLFWEGAVENIIRHSMDRYSRCWEFFADEAKFEERL